MDENSCKVTSDEQIKKTFDDTLAIASDFKQHLRLLPASLETLKENAEKTGQKEVIQHVTDKSEEFLKDIKTIEGLIAKVETTLTKLHDGGVELRNQSGRLVTQPTDSGIGSACIDSFPSRNSEICSGCIDSLPPRNNNEISHGIQDTNPPDNTTRVPLVLSETGENLCGSEDC